VKIVAKESIFHAPEAQITFAHAIDRDERIYVFQIQICSNDFISNSNPNPKTDSFKIQILFKNQIRITVIRLYVIQFKTKKQLGK